MEVQGALRHYDNDWQPTPKALLDEPNGGSSVTADVKLARVGEVKLTHP
jgi:hypothetical protein